MNRLDFYVGFAKEYGISQAKARTICDSVFEYLATKIVEEDKVYIFGLGVFKKKHYKARKIGNISGDGSVNIPGKTKVNFEATPQIQAAINGLEVEVNGASGIEDEDLNEDE